MAHEERFEDERAGLLRLAYRMLGTVADAEDAVQEASVRWLRLDAAQRAAIVNPGAWLTRTTSRICLDALGTARARRERSVGEWLPEPIPGDSVLVGGSGRTADDPLDRITLDESVGTALLIVLETLTPAERVAFVLHDVFGVPFGEVAEIVGRSPDAARQLASQARRRIRAGRQRSVGRAAHDRVAVAFAEACATGDLASLVGVLDPSVTLRSDGGGVRSSALRPVLGADRVARFLLGILGQNPDAIVAPVDVPGGLGFLVTVDGAVDSVVTLGTDGDRVTAVWIVRDPGKLGLWS